jgi:hypothetical protein
LNLWINQFSNDWIVFLFFSIQEAFLRWVSELLLWEIWSGCLVFKIEVLLILVLYKMLFNYLFSICIELINCFLIINLFYNFVGKMWTVSLIIWWETWSKNWFSVGWVLTTATEHFIHFAWFPKCSSFSTKLSYRESVLLEFL